VHWHNQWHTQSILTMANGLMSFHQPIGSFPIRKIKMALYEFVWKSIKSTEIEKKCVLIITEKYFAY